VRRFHHPSGDCDFVCLKSYLNPRWDISTYRNVLVRFLFSERRPSHICCPGETSPYLCPGRVVLVTFVAPDRRPSHICRPGETSPYLCPGRVVLVTFVAPDRRPSHICRPGETSLSDLSPRRGFLTKSLLLVTIRRNAYTRTPNTRYTVILLLLILVYRLIRACRPTQTIAAIYTR